MNANQIIGHCLNCLAQSVNAITNADDFDEQAKAIALAQSFAQAQQYLRACGIIEPAVSKGRLERALRAAKRYAIDMAKLRRESAERAAGSDVAKFSSRRDHKVGLEGLAAAVTEHALDMLAHHRRRYGFEKGGEQPSASENLDTVLKECGPVRICKYIVEQGRTRFTEFELTSALTKYATEQYPDLSPDVAFAKLYENPEVWQAIDVAKGRAPFPTAGVPGRPIDGGKEGGVGGDGIEDDDDAHDQKAKPGVVTPYSPPRPDARNRSTKPLDKKHPYHDHLGRLCKARAPFPTAGAPGTVIDGGKEGPVGGDGIEDDDNSPRPAARSVLSPEYYSPRVTHVGQEAKDTVTDPKVAMQTLARIGRQKWPEERSDVQFARAFEDPANRELAARAYQRPVATW